MTPLRGRDRTGERDLLARAGADSEFVDAVQVRLDAHPNGHEHDIRPPAELWGEAVEEALDQAAWALLAIANQNSPADDATRALQWWLLSHAHRSWRIAMDLQAITNGEGGA